MSANDAGLFDLQDGEVVLHAVRCQACGSTLFPPQHYGCERCGAFGSQLVDVTVAARGSLHSFSTVHRHSRLPTPFQIAEVLTDAQSIVRARLDHPSAAIGAPVAAEIRFEDGRDTVVFVSEERN